MMDYKTPVWTNKPKQKKSSGALPERVKKLEDAIKGITDSGEQINALLETLYQEISKTYKELAGNITKYREMEYVISELRSKIEMIEKVLSQVSED